MQPKKKQSDKKEKHGTKYIYNLGCRCKPCLEWRKKRHAKYSAKQKFRLYYLSDINKKDEKSS
jgi:hypothetical protein